MRMESQSDGIGFTIISGPPIVDGNATPPAFLVIVWVWARGLHPWLSNIAAPPLMRKISRCCHYRVT